LKVHKAAQDGAEDGQSGVPVGEAHHLKGGLGETEKEVDDDEGRNQDEQQDDDGQRQEEKFEQALAPANELSLIVNRALQGVYR